MTVDEALAVDRRDFRSLGDGREKALNVLAGEVERLRADLATAADLLRRGARNYDAIAMPGGWGDQAWTLAQRVSPDREGT